MTLLLLPKITKTCQTGYTNHDRHKIKIEHDIIDKPVKLDILNEIPAHFIHEIKTIAYDVSDVNLFPPHLNEIPPKKTEVKHPSYTTERKRKDKMKNDVVANFRSICALFGCRVS